MRGASRRFGAELALWIPVGVIPIFNGVIRMTTYGRVIAEPLASWISSSCDVLGVILYAALLQGRPATRAGRPERRGLLWLTLTTLNHFLLGHFAFGLSSAQLLWKYDLWAGQTWGAISAMIALAPITAAWLRAARSSTAAPR